MANSNKVYEVEATVVTGLEDVAKDELEKRLEAQVYEVNLGRVNFLVSDLRKILDLRSVENMYIIIHRFDDVKFSSDLEECLEIMKSLVNNVDWNDALKTWRKFASAEQCPISDDLPSYRVTCKRSGNHCFESPQAATHFGGALNDFLGWKVNLSDFEVEVMLLISQNEVRVGIALTKESMHRRNIINFGNTTLKPTIAHGMLWHCRIQPGDIVCDPLCGSGSIPVENAAAHPSSFNLCGDVGSNLVRRTLDNWTNFVNKSGRLPVGTDILRWDSCRLPLRDNSVDVFVSDLPFGKRVGSKKNNWKLYPGILSEFARVAKTSTGRACLLTQDKMCMTKSLEGVNKFWKRGATIPINIGGLVACMYVLYRTSTTFK